MADEAKSGIGPALLRFLGNLLIAIGILILTMAGLCTLILIGLEGLSNSSQSSGAVQMSIVTAGGGLIIVAGLALKSRAGPPPPRPIFEELPPRQSPWTKRDPP